MNIEAELARLRTERERLDVLIGYLETQRNGSRPAARPRRRPAGTLTAAAAAEQALTQAGAPMRTGDLLKAVQGLGAQMKDNEGLAKTLGRSDRFVKVGRGLWSLK